MPGRHAGFPLDKGFFNTYAIADPGSNADVAWTPPVNLIVMPLTFFLTLTVADAGSIRGLFLEVDIPNGTLLWEYRHPRQAPINQVTRCAGHLNASTQVNVTLEVATFPIPVVYLSSLDRLFFRYTSKEAGDRITNFRVSGLEWRDTP